jgi:cytochrome c551/c552
MIRIHLLSLATAAAIALGACGGKAPESPETSSPATAGAPEAARSETRAPGPTSLAQLDAGPRAAEAPVDEAAAERGEKLLQAKGCTACHAFGTKLSGPDLEGVAARRTEKWMESQILYPDRMVKEDPTARQLFAQHALQMPNLGVTAGEARDIIEYFKHRQHEAGEADKD